jgi:lipoate-protein ligase A
VSGPIRLLVPGGLPPLRTQALYHGLAQAMDGGSPDTLVLCWPTAPYFCVGYHQTAGDVLDLPLCRRQGWPVLRRKIGGGAVYLDEAQLFYQVVVHRRRAPFAVADLYRAFLAAPVLALRRLGLDARLAGINEIEVGGRRIAGTGAGQLGEAAVVVGNVLFGFRPARMARAWRVPSPSFRRLAGEGLRRYLTTLEAELARVPSRETVAQLLAECYAEALDRPVVAGRLDDREARMVAEAEAELAAEAFVLARTWRPPHGLKIARGVFVREIVLAADRAPVRLTVRLRDGVIDALALTPPAGPWAEGLVGVPLEPAALAERLHGVPEGGAVLDALLGLARRADAG